MFSWLGYGEKSEEKKEVSDGENAAEKSKNVDEGSEVPESTGNEGSGVEEQQQPKDGDPDSKKASGESFQPDLDYAKDVAKNVGSFLFSMASAATTTAIKVKDTVEKKTIIGDFMKEQEKFVNEKHKRSESAVPPWVGYNEEETMKTQILALSTDERNFLRDPPSGVPFHYENETMFPVALATLAEDENLTKMRFSLVPKKITEERFWRNYFYRVSLIKQSTQLTSLASAGPTERPVTPAETTKGKVDMEPSKSAPQSIPSSREQKTEEDLPESPTHQVEFISDDYAQQDIAQQELSNEDLQQMGMAKGDVKEADGDTTQKPTVPSDPVADPPPDDDLPEWEKELQKELQDYEVVDGEDNGAWEKEIEDLLDEEDS